MQTTSDSFLQNRAVSRANFIPVDQYGRPKKCPPPLKKKLKLLGLTCLFLKRKYNETHKDFSVKIISTTADVERRFSFLIFLLTKLRNTLAPHSLDKLMQ